MSARIATPGVKLPVTRSVDQAAQLRSLMTAAKPAKRATVIAITSGKGGVGKSNIAVNLAIKLTMAGKNDTSAAAATFDHMPVPNQSTRSGAMATIGVVFNAMARG